MAPQWAQGSSLDEKPLPMRKRACTYCMLCRFAFSDPMQLMSANRQRLALAFAGASSHLPKRHMGAPEGPIEAETRARRYRNLLQLNGRDHA